MRSLKLIKSALWNTISVGISAFFTIELTSTSIDYEYFWLYLLSLTFVISLIINKVRQPSDKEDGALVVVDSDVGTDLGLNLFIDIEELKTRDDVEFSVRYSKSQHKQ
jgi:hypothetical protein